MKIGNSARRGFTLPELLLVLAILALLAGLVAPAAMGRVAQARETALKENLYLIRKSLDDFRADKGVYPQSLEQLVELRYLRFVPEDPMTGEATTWILVRDEAKENPGIWDVRSGAPGEAADGSSYDSW